LERIRTTVRIAGKDYTMTSYDSEEYVQRVATYVDRKMGELSIATRLPSAQLSVLVAMSVTDDMLKAHDENNRLKREIGLVREQLASMQRELDAAKSQAGAN